jgi:hypothetical protein
MGKDSILIEGKPNTHPATTLFQAGLSTDRTALKVRQVESCQPRRGFPGADLVGLSPAAKNDH